MSEADHEMQAHLMEQWMDSPFEMMMKVEQLLKWSQITPTIGCFAYLFVAAFATTHYALAAFRYTSKTGYYNTFKVGSDTEWYKFGNYIINYGNLSLFGIAFITQLLAVFGIAPMINYLVWFWGIMVGGGVVNMLGQFFYFLGYDSAYSANTVAGNAQQTLIKTAMVEEVANQAKIGYALMSQYENWHWSLFNALSEEEQEATIMEIYEEIALWEEQVMADMEDDSSESLDDSV